MSDYTEAIEEQILELILRQMTSREISEKLFFSLKTVEGYRRRLFLKADAKNIVGLILWAIKNGYGSTYTFPESNKPPRHDREHTSIANHNS